MIVNVPVDDVVVEGRTRRVHGIEEMTSLEVSISAVGLLQPIGITPDYKLIFGARRLKACKRIGMETIPARIINVESDDIYTRLQMEHDENEHRLPFTPSERVEIARKIEESFAGRQGQRTDLEHVPNSAQVEPGTKTRDIAAKAVGMKRETYRQAKAVVDSGNQEVIEQMDSGDISVHAAYQKLKQEKEAAELRAKQAEAARQLAINQHSEQQDKLLSQIDELKKRKGRSKEDDERLRQLVAEKEELARTIRQMQDDFSERYSALEKKQHDLRKMKESLNKTRAYVDVDLSAALMHFMSIRDQREAQEVAEQFWKSLDDTIAKNRREWAALMQNPIAEEVNQGAGTVIDIGGN